MTVPIVLEQDLTISQLGTRWGLSNSQCLPTHLRLPRNLAQRLRHTVWHSRRSGGYRIYNVARVQKRRNQVANLHVIVHLAVGEIRIEQYQGRQEGTPVR